MRRHFSSYNPRLVEQGWRTRVWPSRQSTRGPWTIVLPPPNVTGQLHLGHALTVSIQDAMVRRKRQEGFDARWIPGVDHAGIATQVVVEKQLAAEGKTSRLEMGRDKFVQRAFEWKEARAEEIMTQFRRLGVAFDWDRMLFTLDAPYAEAVTELFCRLHEQGLLYRGSRAVNWCPALQSVVSDIEVDLRQVAGLLHFIDYGNGIKVATTRPETIYADVAVAVHSKDVRYEGIFECINPLTGETLPVIRDDVLVDMDMGTGAVKVTPAHSVEDHECGLRHSLPMDRVAFDERGKMLSDNVGVKGLDRIEARRPVVDILKELGCYLGSKTQPQMRIPTCSRSGDVLEPSWKPQWYVDTKQMSKRALGYTDSIIPEKFHGDWKHFLVEQRDWCISRQLWWGHRIPAYRLESGEWIVSRTPPASYCEQDPDVLDTWFSSALFPLVALGWPKQLDTSRYPINVMETGSDILFFWVARMAMICSEMEPAAGAPFARVALHPMVRDRHGRKMSKSVGNVIDPVHLIQGKSLEDLVANVEQNKSNLAAAEVKKSIKLLRAEFPRGMPECGADALRFTLIDNESNDFVNLDIASVEAANRMCNKIWNAAKFVQSRPRPAISFLAKSAPDRWLEAQLATLSNQMLAGFQSDFLHRCTKGLKSFLLAFCDHYIEYAKIKNSPESDYFLHKMFDAFLVQLHPFMPFLTEHLLDSTDVINMPVPTEQVVINEERDVEPFAHILALVSAVRQLKTARREPFSVWVENPSSEMFEHEGIIQSLTRLPNVTIGVAPSDSDYLVVPIRGQLSMEVLPKQEAAQEAFLLRKLERLETKLQRLEDKWAKTDMSKVRQVAQTNYEKTRAVLKSQIEALREN